MANDNKQKQPRWNTLRNMASRIQQNTDDLYKSTYYADSTNKRQLQNIKAGITASIKDIMDSNADNIGEPNISKLYERLLMNAQNDPATVDQFERIFGDNDFINNLSSSYLDNRWVKEVDNEIDEVLKYMPKLQEALDTISDNVLSADSFNKDFLNLESHISGMDPTAAEQFSRNITDMKDRYELLKLTKKINDDIQKYGEEFVYCVPYTKAIQRLTDRKGMFDQMAVRTNYGESVIIESANSKFDTIKIQESLSEGEGINLNITYEKGIITSIVESEVRARKKKQAVDKQSLTESFYLEQASIEEAGASSIDITRTAHSYIADKVADHDLEMGEKLPVHHHFDHTLDDELELPNDDNTSSEGLIQSRKQNSKVKDMNGCIVKILKRENVTPIILNDICLGYYYFEYDPQSVIFDERGTTTGMVNTITGLRSNGRSEAFDSMARREELLRNISSQLADRIDPEFINNNQDLKKEIYYILKYNDSFNAAAASNNNIRVSYIPPEDIHHMYFDLDEDTGRGISDLQLSMIPAKLWVSIYITNCLAIMTRGNDKRVYYVKQSVESNISKTLLKTIDEIKKSNFGIRQIENINSVLNVVGRFNDYIIPRGQDGQAPIEMEVLQGQQVEIKTDLLNLLEESAINVTGVPIEIIQNRQSPEYALQLTMSNSKFLRFVYARQSDLQKILNPLYSKIYNFEYGANITINTILPVPLFINVTNCNQLIANTRDYCQNLTDIIMADEQDDSIKAKFLRDLTMYHLGSYVNMDVIDHIKNKAKQDSTMDIVTNPENMAQD